MEAHGPSWVDDIELDRRLYLVFSRRQIEQSSHNETLLCDTPLCHRIIGLSVIDFGVIVAVLGIVTLSCMTFGVYTWWKMRRRRQRELASKRRGFLLGNAAAAALEEGKAASSMKVGVGQEQQAQQDSIGVAADSQKQTKEEIQKARTAERMTLLRAMQMRQQAEARSKERSASRLALSSFSRSSNRVSSAGDDDADEDVHAVGGLYGIEQIVGKHVKPLVGMRVTLRRPKGGETSQAYNQRLMARGTIVWVDPTDVDGDGQTGDLSAVVWDATGARGLHNTGLSGLFDLAVAKGVDGEGNEETTVFRRPVTLAPLRQKPWRGLGLERPGGRGEGDAEEKLHEVIILDRKGMRKAQEGRAQDQSYLARVRRTLSDRSAAALRSKSPQKHRMMKMKMKMMSNSATASAAQQQQGDAQQETAHTYNSDGDEGGRDLGEPLGVVTVTLLGARDLPMKPIPGFRGKRKCVCVVSVRGEEILRTLERTDECNPTWEGARGCGTMWQEGDTVQIDVFEVVHGGRRDRIGSARLYVDEMWGGARGAAPSAEKDCVKCEGLGFIGDEDVACLDCVRSGKCHQEWLPLQICASRTACVGVRCKFQPLKGDGGDGKVKWHEAKGDGLLPAELACVSAHDNRAILDWKKEMRACTKALQMIMVSRDYTTDQLARIVARAAALGIFIPDRPGARTNSESDAWGQTAPRGTDAEAEALAKKAHERLMVLRAREGKMPPCAANLQASIDTWYAMSTQAQRAAVVFTVVNKLQKDLTEAAELGMHRVERYKATIESAMVMLADVERVLDDALDARDRADIPKKPRAKALNPMDKKKRKKVLRGSNAPRGDWDGFNEVARANY